MNMTNKSINKTCYIYFSLVQNKVLNGGGYYLLTNLSKLNNNYFNIYNNG